LAERNDGIVEVVGSIPASSTKEGNMSGLADEANLWLQIEREKQEGDTVGEGEQVLKAARAGELQPWWCLDSYLCALLAEQLTKLRDDGISYPQDMTPESWKEFLTSLIEPLAAYDVDNPIAYTAAQGALRQIAARLNEFWD
jgi:hypothetical protein